MNETNRPQSPSPIALLPYHTAIVDYLKRNDAKVWNWFAKAARDPQAAEELRFDLLKSTYRIERGASLAMYEIADEAAGRLGVSVPITIYQAQHVDGLNAALAFAPEEVHLILHGPVAEKLTRPEIKALFGHELGHHVLWLDRQGELFVANEVLRALTNDQRAHPAHLASFRLLGLYNEILCDRAALLAAGDVHTVVAMQLKVETGVSEANAEAYLRQAEEIFGRGQTSTAGMTHPEGFIRARALALAAEQRPDATELIEQMIEGSPGLDDLDLLAQERVARGTRRLLDSLLCRKWFQSDVVLAQARLYFDDYSPPAEMIVDGDLSKHVRIVPDSMRDYYCFVLLDFAAADREIDEPALAATLAMAETIGVKRRFVELARQELRLRKQQLEKIDEQQATILADAERLAAAET
jgi:hypothetical protein